MAIKKLNINDSIGAWDKPVIKKVKETGNCCGTCPINGKSQDVRQNENREGDQILMEVM